MSAKSTKAGSQNETEKPPRGVITVHSNNNITTFADVRSLGGTILKGVKVESEDDFENLLEELIGYNKKTPTPHLQKMYKDSEVFGMFAVSEKLPIPSVSELGLVLSTDTSESESPPLPDTLSSLIEDVD